MQKPILIGGLKVGDRFSFIPSELTYRVLDIDNAREAQVTFLRVEHPIGLKDRIVKPMHTWVYLNI